MNFQRHVEFNSAMEFKISSQLLFHCILSTIETIR